ncbi:MAG: glycosyltransferase family 9 protein [Verrucomicrobiota bacterium]
MNLPADARVLVLKPSSLGDIVHTLPVVHAIKKAHPGWRLHWVVNPEWAPLLEGNADLAGRIRFPRRSLRGLALPFRFHAWAKTLPAKGPWDLALDFQGLLRSGLMACYSRAPHRLGLRDSREGARFFQTALAETAGLRHAIDRYFALAKLVGVARPDRLVTPLPEAAPPAMADLSQAVVLHPWSRGEGKSLTHGEIERIASEFYPRRVVLVGRPDKKRQVLGGKLRNLADQTSLPQLVQLMRQAAFVISVDSGPLHLANAVTHRLLGIHFWSDPRQVGPYRPEAFVWKDGQIRSVAHYQPAEKSDPTLRPDIVKLTTFVEGQIQQAAS